MEIKQFCARYSMDRVGTNSLKWDALDKRYGDKNLIPMWVADMEFRAPEVVVNAMKKRIEHGIFGYSYVPDSYYNSFINWERNQHNYEVDKKWIRFSTGVVVSLYWFVNAFTKFGDSVIILTPVYYPFHDAVKDTGRRLITSELINVNGVYTIDFEDFERNIMENDVKLFIQCSPHNPVGRVWTEKELDKILSICKRYNVLVVSDEIHQDIIIGENVQIPAAIVSGAKYADNIITVTAPSKTFNLAGLLNCNIIISNEKVMARYDAYSKTINKTEVNIMGLTAAEAAYNYGEEWLKSLLGVIKHNYNHVKERLGDKAPKIVVTPLEGTYLIWVDLRGYIEPNETKTFIQEKCRLAVDYGEWFGENCKGFIRLNMATNPKYVEKAVDNIIKNINCL
ncbi:MalY/PatB family protein [Clostridium estertheticum]|uniref:cysteine-S-conjugate beta-lyase n=1 Tax=Clostridium estertheticum subsp. estertheticum TaxID=1552 RepID=A0A1J0GMX5_9CLOT|nr:MalY/PatB family protein [Clostridium estertheticum]APC42262.1 aminotransferase [Clostridium estertheticum subsp. estertheticum]MBU3073640.1 pyridoxal phosphate-dependent aminotransferase [Clostridium estertheticum]MBU3163733.1 pyridoxal phosphate-dependent aminotransferase [Clostridium estertheticum]MBU3172227.1 pyridoxal phosphate-dependent aminotransferase [Clostridium estertheticum]MBZ9615808.1 pyridoxal phosphate-dependent aminotransferase [Clostridium estertheticum subsp. laramiense]